MKIVVTGALGHIGSRLIRALPGLIPAVEIIMVDNLRTNRYTSMFNLPAEGRYHFIEADVLDFDLCSVFRGAHAVVHLAAITDATSSFHNREEVEHVNYDGTVKVAKACMEVQCPMIHMSSTSVYGTQKNLVDEDSSESDLNPQSPYAETKLKEERYLLSLGSSGALRFVILRNGTIYGISPGMRFHTAVNKFCWQAVMQQPLTVWRTALHQKRPYLDLSDAVEAMAFIIKKDHFDCRVYNVLSNNLTVHDIVSQIECYIPRISVHYVDSEIMNQMSYEVANEHFQKLGFTFRGDIKKGIGETIDLLKGANNQDAPVGQGR
jgi:UDP-glucose 4-epimerase